MNNFFTCWPELKAYAKQLSSKRFPGLFYYDYTPPGNLKKTTLILLHGLGDEADTFRHVIPLLGKAGYRMLAPDLPCFGRSTSPRRSSISLQRDAVLELIKSIPENSEQGFILIGSSMGAAVAEAVVLAELNTTGNRIKALVLIDGCFPVESSGSAEGSGSSKLLFSALPFVGKKWYRSFRKNPEKAWQSLFSYYADIQSLSQEDKDFLRKRVMDRVCSPTQERAYFSTLRSMIFQSIRSSYYKRIGSWPGKLCLIWGEKDNIMPHAVIEPFIKLRGNNNTELSIIKGSGHLPHQEKPAETAEVILEFLDLPSPLYCD